MKALVCGLGPSLELLHASRYRGLIVGVNNIESRGIVPHHLVVCDQMEHFADERRQAIIMSAAPQFWTTQGGWNWHRWTVQCSPKGCERGDVDLGSYGKLWLCTAFVSPFTAVHVAQQIGATSIALLGVDLTPDHTTYGHRDEINAAFGRMHAALAERGVELVNLSPTSNLVSVPKVSAEAWLNS